MGVELYVANLLRVAKQDLDGARSLVRDENRNAIYLCEQAAEKILIAVLTSEQKHARVLPRRLPARRPGPGPSCVRGATAQQSDWPNKYGLK